MLIAYSNKTLSVVNHEFIWMNEKIMSNDIVGMKSMLVEESIVKFLFISKFIIRALTKLQ